MGQQPTVGPQLSATALTPAERERSKSGDSTRVCTGSELRAQQKTNSQEIYVRFVVMAHVLHQLLHVGEGAGAVGHGAQHDLPWRETE